jgi:CubicO group peptidase (beta-lactamase class C family)
MPRPRRTPPCAALLLSLAACAVTLDAQAQPAASTHAPGARATLPATLDARVPGWLAQHRVPSMAIAYVENGAVAWTRVYGEQSAGVPASSQTLYNVASLTKPVFAEVMLQLAAAGRLSLDEPLASHWVDPDVADDPRHRTLTPRLALSHRLGFPNWRPAAGRLRFQLPPDSAYLYSGEGFEYLRRFAERKLGASVDELARQYVFAPRGMKSTAFVEQPWFAGRVAAGRGPDGEYGAPDFARAGNAADLLYATIGDYATFLVGEMSRTGLTPRVASERDSLHAVDPAELAACRAKIGARCPTRIGYGLGWSIMEYPGFTVRWHTGADRGHKAMVFYFPELRRGAVMLTNGANGFPPMIEVGILLSHDTPFASFLETGRS